MSDETTPRLGLPTIRPGQAQKEMSHNEALVTIDRLLQASVVSFAIDTPPATPGEGEAWVLGTLPTGAWSGKAHWLAAWSAGGWRFSAPVEGMAVWVADQGVAARFSAGNWEIGVLRGTTVVIGGVPVIGARGPAIAAAMGGTVIDSEARATLDAVLTALRTHGLIET